jgi:tetratricopeptide (TPR) repeat protein
MADTVSALTAALADRYAIQRELGRGGMATVYLAEDLKHHRPVALKVLKPELAHVLGPERFLREIELSARLTHPHILPLHDSGNADGILYYVMPYVEGESLRDRLTREKQLPVDDALQISREVADALSYAHAHGVIHRDVKPENILLEAGHAVVADFGIARAIDHAGGDRLTGTGIALGTPAYMSPEQAAGSKDLDGRSDLYALGCVLYEMLAGHPPFVGASVESLVHQHLTAEPPTITGIRPAVPAHVVAALTQSLAKTPADRFNPVALFGEAIAPRASVSEVPAAVRAAPRTSAMKRWLGWAAGVVVLGIAAFVTWEHFRAPADLGPPPEDRPFTVLAAVEGSADSATRDAVEFLLRNGLDMAYVVQTVPVTEIQRFLTLMDQAPTTPLEPATARDLARRAGVTTVVLPRLDRLAGTYALEVRVEDVASGQLRAQASGRAAEAGFVEMVDDVSRRLRRDLGETRAALANTDALPAVVTPSLDALLKYQEGNKLRLSSGPARQAAIAYREAVTLDTAFAAAWSGLWVSYAILNESDSATGALRQAVRFRDRLNEFARANLEATFEWVTDVRLWDDALEIKERDVRRRPWPDSQLGWMIAQLGFLDSALNLGKARRAGATKHARRLDPSRPLSTCWGNPWEYAAATGRVQEWLDFLDSLRVDMPPECAYQLNWDNSLATGDWDRADRMLREGPDRLRARAGRYAYQLEAVRGQITAAHANFARAEDSNVSGPAMIPALILEVVYGVPGSDTITRLTGHSWKPVLKYASHGARAALVGDTSEAKRVLTRLRAMRDSGTSQHFEHAFAPILALIRAGPAARRGDWRSVVAQLQPSDEQFREPGYGFLAGDTYLRWWLLSEAYTNLGRPDSAIVYLQSMIARPRYREYDWTIYGLAYSAAQFKLGQLYAQLGDADRAAEHYGTFLHTFTKPDPEYEWMVTEARAKLEELARGR